MWTDEKIKNEAREVAPMIFSSDPLNGVAMAVEHALRKQRSDIAQHIMLAQNPLKHQVTLRNSKSHTLLYIMNLHTIPRAGEFVEVADNDLADVLMFKVDRVIHSVNSVTLHVSACER